MPTVSSVGPFRGLAPYLEEDADLFYGRDHERTELLRLATDPAVSNILVTGEVGTGKTSLLRAGLIPRLANTDVIPIYISCGNGWREALQLEFHRLADQTKHPGRNGDSPWEQFSEQHRSKLLLILDHVELLLWASPAEVESYKEVISSALSQPRIRMVLAADRGNLHSLALLGEAFSTIPANHTVTLGRWEREQASQVMEQMVLGGYGYMEAGLPQIMASELCESGPVLPAALQVVGHAAVLRRATSKRTYAKNGGALALTTFYVSELAQRAGGWKARRVLAVLSEQPNSNVEISGATIAQRAGLPEATTEKLLVSLTKEKLLRSHSLPAIEAIGLKPKFSYAILHHYLRQPIRDYVAPVNRGRARARVALKRSFSRFHLLFPGELIQVWRHLGSSLNDQERALFLKSRRVWMITAAALVALPLLSLLIMYVGLIRSSYLDMAEEISRAPQVVLRSGKPSPGLAMAILPGDFHRMEFDTGISHGSLSTDMARQIAGHQIVGRLQSKQASMPSWFTQVLSGVSPTRQAAFLILSGERSQGAQLLRKEVAQSGDKRRAIEIASLLLDSAELQPILEQGLSDVQPDIRLLTVAKTSHLDDKSRLPILEQALKDRDSNVKQAAVQALWRLKPKVAVPLIGRCLRDSDPRIQKEVRAYLDGLSASHFPQVLGLGLELSTASGEVKQNIERVIRRMLAQSPKELSHQLLKKLQHAAPSYRPLLLRWLSLVVEQMDSSLIQSTINRLVEDSNLFVRTTALSIQARFDDPKIVLPKLLEMADDAQPELRRAAAIGMGLMKTPVEYKRWDALKALLRDRTAVVRSAAIRSFLSIGSLGLYEVTRAMKNGPLDVAQTALQTVCEQNTPNVPITTAVLAVAWKLNRPALREQTMSCVQGLAKVSPRLPMWLADQAYRDKEPQIRRAGATAATLALQTGKDKMARLASLYLGDSDPAIRASFLQRMVQHLPTPASFLYSYVEPMAKDKVAIVRAASIPAMLNTVSQPQKLLPVLSRLLKDTDGEVRRAAIDALAKLSPAISIKSIEEQLAVLMGKASRKEALALIQITRKFHLIAPLHQARAHDDVTVRLEALGILAADHKDSAALMALGAVLKEPDPVIRLNALQGIAKAAASQGQLAVQYLWQATFMDDPGLRWAAFRALANIVGRGEIVAKELLLQAAEDPSEERRRIAIAVLGNMTSRNYDILPVLFNARLDPALDVRREAQSAVAAHWGRSSSIDELWHLLENSPQSGLTRRIATVALAWYGRKHGFDPLAKRLSAMKPETPLVTRVAGQLALSLARTDESPNDVINWLYGW